MIRLQTLLVALVVLAAIPAVSLADTAHVVRKGDTLGKIARAHHVSVAAIQAANGLEGTRLSVGTKLVLPAPPESAPAAGAWKPPTEAELAVLARGGRPADAALPAVAAFPAAPDTRAERAGDESIKDRLLRVARRMLEVPYRYGGTTLWGLDCSGFVQKAFAFLDLDLPHSARAQFREGIKISKAELSAGDLVFFRTRAKYPSHVGIYLGDNRFIHASSHDRKVTIDSLDEPYYTKHYLGAKRLLFEGNESLPQAQ